MKSSTDSVRTPKNILASIRKEFGPFFDPAPFRKKFDPKKHTDGLKIDWKPVTFVNPPYSRVEPWVQKAHAEWRKGNTVIMFIKLENIGTAYAKKYIRGAELRILSEKLSFPGYSGKARFNNVLVIWRNNKHSYKYSII